MPVRSASSSTASGRLPCARPADPRPSAGTILPSRNFTVRLAPFEAAPGAAAKAEALDSAAIVVLMMGSGEPSAAQSPLNSRRLSNCFFISSNMARRPSPVQADAAEIGTAASVRLDVEGPDDVAPLLGFLSDELDRGRAGKNRAAQLAKPRLKLG